MVGLGTLINAGGVLIGGILGLLGGKALKRSLRDMLLYACAVAVIMIGISGALQEILVIEDGALETSGIIMMIVSLAAGSFLGSLIDIERQVERFGTWLKNKSNSAHDPRFVDGFVSTSLTICIGALSILGPINDALYGDYSLLITKAIIDSIVVFVLASSLGKGCVFSVFPLILFQGAVTILAKSIESLMTPQAVDNLSLVGSVLIFCIGVNLVFGKKAKVANMLPSLAIAVACAFLPIS